MRDYNNYHRQPTFPDLHFEISAEAIGDRTEELNESSRRLDTDNPVLIKDYFLSLYDNIVRSAYYSHNSKFDSTEHTKFNVRIDVEVIKEEEKEEDNED